MPKSSRSITPKTASKSQRKTSPAHQAAPSSSKPSKNGHAKSEKPDPKANQKNGHKNGKTEGTSSVATPSKSIADSHEKDAKGVQAVWTGQPERQERLRDLVKLAKDQGYLTWDDLNEAIPESVNNPEELEATRPRSTVTSKAPPARRKSFPTRKKPTRSSIFWTIPSGCTSSRWGRCRC
jgi:RNA polymerase primary sigma factor